MENNTTIDRLMELPRIKNLGLKRESVSNILKAYSDIAFEELLENGYIVLNNGLCIEIVRLIDRVHVLRGVSYKSNRKYKLKLNMEESVYKKIEDYYNALEEGII